MMLRWCCQYELIKNKLDIKTNNIRYIIFYAFYDTLADMKILIRFLVQDKLI